MTINIRKCTPDDALALSVLAKSTFFDTFTGTCTEEDMEVFLEQFYSEQRMKEELSSKENYYFFALIDEQPAGYIRFLENPVPYEYPQHLQALELNRLYIDKAYKGLGIGKQLVDIYELFAKENGYNYLWLGVWEFNFKAQAFYKKMGYCYTGFGHPFPINNTPQTDQWWSKVI
jgi:ribosomal protein S18 acetylase RimI-like enzyme